MINDLIRYRGYHADPGDTDGMTALYPTEAEALAMLNASKSGQGTAWVSPEFVGGMDTVLTARQQLSYLLVAHNLATVRYIAHHTAVMYLGRIVEYAETERLYRNPLHPYTKALFSAALPADPDAPREDMVLSGEVPSPIDPPSGCHFHPRCPLEMEQCSRVAPEAKAVAPGHQVACHLY